MHLELDDSTIRMKGNKGEFETSKMSYNISEGLGNSKKYTNI